MSDKANWLFNLEEVRSKLKHQRERWGATATLTGAYNIKVKPTNENSKIKYLTGGSSELAMSEG